jgi:hypothetical protein
VQEARRAETLGKRLLPRLEVAWRAVLDQIAALGRCRDRLAAAIEEVKAGREPDLTGLKLGKGVVVGEKRPRSAAQIEHLRQMREKARAPKGQQGVQAVTRERAEEIRQHYAAGAGSVRQMAIEYGISSSTMNAILKRRGAYRERE